MGFSPRMDLAKSNAGSQNSPSKSQVLIGLLRFSPTSLLQTESVNECD